MLDSICDSIALALSAENLNAVRKFPPDKLERSESIVCVSLKSASITASGLGNYIGLCTQDGVLREMYGSRAELKLGFELYSPTPDCDVLTDTLMEKLFELSSLTIKSFDAGEVEYDTKSGMFCRKCTASASACLIRQLSDYVVEGEE